MLLRSWNIWQLMLLCRNWAKSVFMSTLKTNRKKLKCIAITTQRCCFAPWRMWSEIELRRASLHSCWNHPVLQGKIIVKYHGPWELLSLLTLWLSGMRVLKVFRAFFYMSRLWFKWYAQAEDRNFQGTWLTHTITCCQNWMCWKQNNKATSFL